MDPSLPSGWSFAGPPQLAPGGTLRRLEGPTGEWAIALHVRSELASHPVLVDGLVPLMPFMRDPDHHLAAPLVHWDRRQALFVYATGPRVLLSEIIAHEAPRPLGERAAKELLTNAAPVLDGTAAAAQRLGLPNHGSLHPSRILVDRDGRVGLLGYGLPDLEAVDWLDGDASPRTSAGAAYWPPERVSDRPEDLTADLYAMGVIAAEVATGRPLLEGVSPGEAVQRAAHGLMDEISALPGLTSGVRDLLMDLSHPAPDRRPGSAAEVAQRARRLMSRLAGRLLGHLARPLLEEPPDALPTADRVLELPVDVWLDSGSTFEVPSWEIEDRGAVEPSLVDDGPPGPGPPGHERLVGGPRVFVGYRRDDVPDATGRIYDRLVLDLGRGSVFKDVDDLPLGELFGPFIQRQLERCTTLLAVIGPRWHGPVPDGSPRIQRDDDWVRVEIEAAFRLGLQVIPVLVNGASLPEPRLLPPSVRPLVERQAAHIERDPYFHAGMDRLLRHLR